MWCCSNKTLFINMSRKPDLAHGLIVYHVLVWNDVPCRSGASVLVTPLLLLRSHVREGSRGNPRTRTLRSYRTHPAPRSCLDMATLDDSVHQNQETRCQHPFQHSPRIYFLNCEKRFYLMTAGIMKKKKKLAKYFLQ